MTKLKTQWRSLFTDEDRDYWRTQFESERTRLQLREELQQKHGLWLTHDMQLRRFCQWVADEDWRDGTAESALCDRAELESQGLAEKDLRQELLRRMKERALARGDFKLAAEALKLDLKAEQVALEAERVALQARKVAVKEREKEVAQQPGGLTPEVLEKIERELNLFGPIVPRNRKSAVQDPDESVAQTSANSQKSRLIKPNKGQTSAPHKNRNPKPLNPEVAEPVAVEPQPAPAQNPPPQPNPKQEASRALTNPSDEWEAGPLDPVQDNPPINPVILSKSRLQDALDPMLEAYNTLDRMNRKIIPYDAAELKRLYAKIPPGTLRTTKY